MKPQYFIGTSGWFYSWNKDKSLDWYIENSKLNSIELNASFYRFPFVNQIKTWAKKGKNLRWAIKVNRLITHIFQFNEKKTFETWEKFRKLFEPMEKQIDFYLFQAPPKFTEQGKEKIEEFFKKTKLGKKFAFEPRNLSWFKKENIEWAKKLKLTWVSMDSPDFSKEIFNTNNIIYLRMHGRTKWYSHNYSKEELKEIAERILNTNPEKIYIYFNNNHSMLDNAREMSALLSKVLPCPG